MSVPLAHLVLASLGLLISACFARWVARRWSSHPTAAYRTVLVVTGLVLLLPGVQRAVQGRGLPGWLGGSEWRLELEPIGAPSAPDADILLFGLLPWLEPPSSSASSLTAAEDAGSQKEPARSPLDAGAVEPSVADGPAVETAEVALVDQRGSAWSDPRLWLALLAIFYLAGLCVALARTFVRWRTTRGILARARPAEATWLELWRSVAGGSAIGRRTRMLVSDELRGPACFGLWRTAVVVPADDPFVARPDVARCVLLHELVHLERRDVLSVWLRELLVAVFWFHPAAYRLAATLDELRELSCDARVVERTGDARTYASSLVEYASVRFTSGPRNAALLAASWPDAPSSLHRRIDMLISLRSNSSPRRGTALVSALLLGSVCIGQAAFAAALFPQSTEPAPPAAPEPLAALAPVTAPAAPLAHIDPPAVVPGAPAPAPVARGLTVTGERVPVIDLKDPAAPSQLMQVEPDRVLLGIYYAEVGEALAAQLGRSAVGMVVVTRVSEGSPAESVGLQTFDVVASVNGAPATSDAFESAGRSLARGESVQLEVIRAGAPRIVVVGPVDDEFKSRWNSQRGLPLMTQSSPFPGRSAPNTTLTVPRSGLSFPRAERAQAGELLGMAREYYDAVDVERFKADLTEALEQMAERDQVSQETKNYAYLLKEIVNQDNRDTQNYLNQVRGWLNKTSPDVFWQNHGERFKNLDRSTFSEMLERWQDAAQTPASPPRPGQPFWNQQRAKGLFGKEQDGTRAELERARAELAYQKARIDELTQRLEELERRARTR